MIKEAIEKRLIELDDEIHKVGREIADCFTRMNILKAKKDEHVDLIMKHAQSQAQGMDADGLKAALKTSENESNGENSDEQQNASTNEQPSAIQSGGREQPSTEPHI